MSTQQEIARMRNLISFLLVGAFVSLLPLLIYKAIPEENEQIITYMIGQLSGMALMALGFYFVNKVGQDEADALKAANTGEAFRAIETVAQGQKQPAGVADAVDQVAAAAENKADEIKGDET